MNNIGCDFAKNIIKISKIMLYFILTMLIITIGYFLYVFLQQFLLKLAKMCQNYFFNGIKTSSLYYFLLYFIGAIGIIFIFHTFKKLNCKNTQKDNFTTRFSYSEILKNVIFVYFIMEIGIFLLSRISNLCYPAQTTNNQQALSMMFNNGGYKMGYVVVLALVISPYIEEMLFRFTILGFLKNKIYHILKPNNDKNHFFIKKILLLALLLFSSACFSLIHNPTDFFSFTEYFWMGLCFGTVYLKFDDIRASISLHVLNNIIALVQMMIVLVW